MGDSIRETQMKKNIGYMLAIVLIIAFTICLVKVENGGEIQGHKDVVKIIKVDHMNIRISFNKVIWMAQAAGFSNCQLSCWRKKILLQGKYSIYKEVFIDKRGGKCRTI